MQLFSLTALFQGINYNTLLTSLNKSAYVVTIFCRCLQDEEVTLTEESLSFKANGVGVKGNNLYSVNLNFYLPIDPEVRINIFQ